MNPTDLMKSYIKSALENQYQINEIKITSSGKKSDGYASDFTFATVSVDTDEGKENNIELAVKTSKKDMLKTYRCTYQREVYFYGTIWPKFVEFQRENCVKDKFNSIPKCYQIISNDSVECIVMENLTKNGYILHDRRIPLNLEHAKLVLQEYGKFHAISFALREKKKDVFENLIVNYDDVMLQFLDESFKESVQKSVKRAADIMKEQNEIELHDLCGQILQKGPNVLVELLNTVEPESAILHGDCWSNNFLFKYKTEDHTSPSEVTIVDWQVSRLNSPALDLSFFLFSTCSETELSHINELLTVYYDSFSKFLTELGCDPDKLFPYSTLLRQWKKYSLFGVLLVTTVLHVILCEDADAPDLGQSEDMAEVLSNVQIRDEKNYKERLTAIYRNYFKYSMSL